MASLIDNGTFTFNPEEVKSYSEIIQELTYEGQNLLTELHDIETGIKHQKQIVFAGRKGLMAKTKVGCTPNSTDGIVLTNKFWNPKLLDFRMEHCQTDVPLQDKLINQWAKVNPDYHNIVEGSNSATGSFLIGIVANAMPEDILAKAWFSDVLADTFANGGNFTNGSDVGLLNTIDGFFKQIFTEADLSTGGKHFTPIVKNAGVNYVNQELATGEALTIVKNLYHKADSRLRKNPDAKILVTSTLYMQLISDLEDKQFLGGFTNITENGVQTLTYRGVPVVEIELWDRIIDEYQNNGTIRFRPHRAVMTVKNNIPVGTPDTESLSKLDAFYDRKDKKNYIDAEYGLDVKLLENYLICVAY